jgi:hypothetical protein
VSADGIAAVSTRRSVTCAAGLTRLNREGRRQPGGVHQEPHKAFAVCLQRLRCVPTAVALRTEISAALSSVLRHTSHSTALALSAAVEPRHPISRASAELSRAGAAERCGVLRSVPEQCLIGCAAERAARGGIASMLPNCPIASAASGSSAMPSS